MNGSTATNPFSSSKKRFRHFITRTLQIYEIEHVAGDTRSVD